MNPLNALKREYWTWERVAAAGLFGLFFLFWGTYNYLTVYSFNYTQAAQDQAIFIQVLYNLTHHFSFGESIYHTSNFLGEQHFSPTFALLAPAALILPNRWLVAFFPLFVIAFCAFTAFKLSRRATNGKFLPLLLLAAALFNPLTPDLINHGIRETMIAMLFLAVALYFYLERRFAIFAVAAVLASLCKEDMPLILLGFAPHALLQRRERRWVLFPLCYGLSAFILINQVVMPALGRSSATGGLGFEYFSEMGTNYFEILLYILAHPWETLLKVFGEPNLRLYRQLLGAFWFLPLLAPEILLIPFTQFMELTLSNARHVADIRNWYMLPIYPFLLIGFVKGLLRAELALGHLWKAASPLLMPVNAPEVDKEYSFNLLRRRWLVSLKSSFAAGRDYRSDSRLTVTALLLAVLAASCFSSGWRTFSGAYAFQGYLINSNPAAREERLGQYLHYLNYLRFYRTLSGHIERQLEAIPPEASVSAQYPLLISLAWRQSLAQFPDLAGAEWVVVDRLLERYPLGDDETRYWSALEALPEKGYKLLLDENGLMIFRLQPDEPPPLPSSCFGNCRRYEAEYLPAGAGTPQQSRRLDINKFELAASAFACRKTAYNSNKLIGDWRLELAPGLNILRFAFHLKEVFLAGSYMMRLEVVEARDSRRLAVFELTEQDLPPRDGVQQVDFRVENPDKKPLPVLIDLIDNHRAIYRLDYVEVRNAGGY